MSEETTKKFSKIYKIIKLILRKFMVFIKGTIRLCGLVIMRLPYRVRVVLLFLVVLLAGSGAGYGVGRYTALKSAEEKAKEIEDMYTMKTGNLEAELKDAVIHNPDKRPWYLTLVNDFNPMEEGYVPELADIGGGHRVDKRIADALKQMIADAEKEGLKPYIRSSYRTIEQQQDLYNIYMGEAIRKGMNYWQALEDTKDSTAYPGRSEHNLGLALDIVSSDYKELDTKQEQTAEAKWLAENCYKYGFILRYPNGKTDITGIVYEPWHYRYVGVEDAAKIQELGVTLEEYLGED